MCDGERNRMSCIHVRATNDGTTHLVRLGLIGTELHEKMAEKRAMSDNSDAAFRALFAVKQHGEKNESG